MTEAPLHEWLRPRLHALLQQAIAAGFARDAAVAVMIDLITAPPFDQAGAQPDGSPHP